MTGAAKQSISPQREHGLLRRFAPRNDGTLISNSKDNSGVEPSLRANGSRECAPDDRLREAIHLAARRAWIASSLSLLAMTNSTRLILPDGQITSDFQKWCQAPFAKIFLFFSDPNQFTDSPRLVPTRGALRTSSTWSGMRWTRAARETNAVCLRTAKSCGSDAPILGVKPVRRSAGDGVKKRGHRGEREVSRKTIARGMPGRSG